jgi:hypothetical protein
MPELSAKDFIQSVLIDEIGSLIDRHPYISFIIMGIGIEFLGKCADSSLVDWHADKRSKRDFKSAINTIPSLQKYVPYLASHDLYGSFRCGLAHSISPKFKITLSSKNQMAHLLEDNGRLNLKVEEFYADFKAACHYILNLSYPINNKMSLNFLEVPGANYLSTISASGSTS